MKSENPSMKAFSLRTQAQQKSEFEMGYWEVICVTPVALNKTILSEELTRYKWYESLIVDRKSVNQDVQLLGDRLWCPTLPRE